LIPRNRFNHNGSSLICLCFNWSLCGNSNGILNAFAYDLQAACSSFLYGMSTAALYSIWKIKVLVNGADKMSSIIVLTDRATCIIFDGGGAVLFEPITKVWFCKMN
jgi:3-oxoacyl-[acyl-carrier-protein] synthase III